MKLIISLILIMTFPFPVLAFDVGLGVLRPFDKTQDNQGKDESDPFSPAISIGHSWNILGEEIFSPRLGFTRQTNNTNDRYGGNYTVESFFLLYDFLHPMTTWIDGGFFRYGFGTFQKKTTGGGGTVTIPNGNSTATAYKPSTSKPSNTLTLNLGFDYHFGTPGETIANHGIIAELFIFQPFDKRKRLLSLGLSYGLYF